MPRHLRAVASLWDDSLAMPKLKHPIGWRVATLLVWAAAAVSAWYWAQASMAAGVPINSDAVPEVGTPDMSSPMTLARLLGATPLAEAGPEPGPAERFVLSGVIASNVGQGAALISVDGKPARPFAVGSELAPGYVLVAVSPREAMLAEGLNAPVRAVLSLPLQTSAVSTTTPQGPASTASSASSAAPAAPVAAVTGVVPLATPGAAGPPPPPARADARRQPQTSLGREDRRTP